ncbi:MAG: IS5 family transposase [Pseudomonadota bacterium]
MSFNQFVLKEQYAKVRGLGDRLELMKEQIDWQPFIPLVSKVFHDNRIEGGRPHTDELIVVRSMLLQSWYGLSDPELEFQCHDRLSFRNFLGFPVNIPDFSTLWKARDRLQKEGVEQKIWHELQRQLDQKGYAIKKGVIQDATFIEAELGRKRHYKEKQAEKKGEQIEYTEKQKRHIDNDGTFSIKHGQVHFGYKNHAKLDVAHTLIREYKVTTASLHDGEIDLVKNGDGTVYRDKGYQGKKLRAKNVKDKTMKRGARGHPLCDKEVQRNKVISSIRSPGERPFGVIKKVFHGGTTRVKTLARISIKEMFKCFAFNLYQLVTLQRRKLAKAL